MLILQRYLFREGLTASLISLLVLMGVLIALFLAELLGDAAQGQLPARSILLLLALRLPEAVLLVGPLALMTGLLLSQGRLAEQSELVVIRSGGASYRRCLLPAALLTVIWAFALLLVSGWLAPKAVVHSNSLLADAARHAVIAGIQAGRFDRLDQGRLTLYVGSVDRSDGSLRDVLIHLDDPEYPQVLSAARGRIWVDPEDDSRYLSLLDGRQLRHRDGLADASLREIRFARNDIRLPLPASATGEEGELGRTLPELWPPRSVLERREWHWRLAAPMAALGLGLLALPLAHRQPRQGRFIGLMIALTLYLIYSNAIHAGLVLMEQSEAATGPGLWPLHALIMGLATLMLIRQWRHW